MNPITVFLADDHAVIRDGLCALLEAQDDIEVVGQAGDGRRAVELVEEFTPDVVVMDISMPELNGIDAAYRIRKQFPSTRIVILSMYSTMEHVFRALRAGASGYLLKESAGSEVVEAIYVVCAGHRYLSPKITDVMVDDYLRGRGGDAGRLLSELSSREREVLQLVAEGVSSRDIAERLNISSTTVDTYRSRVMHKLGIEDITALIKFAIRHGLTPL